MFVLFDGDDGSDDTLRFIEEKGRVGLWSVDLPSQKLEFSRGLFALLGLEPRPDGASADLVVSSIHPEDRTLLPELERRISEGLSIEAELRVLRPQGGARWVAVRGEVLFDRDGRPRKAVGLAFDVTSRQEALKALEAQEERQRALLAAISEVVWTTRPDGTVIDCPEWRKLTGQTVEEVRGWGWIGALHPDDRAATEAAWRRAVAERAPFGVEFRVCHADGEYRWHRSRGAAVLNRDGTPREWIGLSLDIHESKTRGALYPLRPEEPAPEITGAQLRAARGLLNWSVRDLSEAARVSAATIRRLEEVNGAPHGPEEAARALRKALEASGIEFLFPSIGKPAVRLR